MGLMLIICYLFGGIKLGAAIGIYIVYKIFIEPDIEINIGKEGKNGRQ